jgi:hypothetical protein
MREDRGGRGGGRGRGHGRGAGRGGGFEEEPYDMDISLGTDADGEDDQAAKEKEGDAQGLTNLAQTNLLEYQSAKNATISPIAEREKKRPRRSEDGEVKNQENPNERSALSFEESGRAQ